MALAPFPSALDQHVFMLAHCAYDRADSVTALFERYSDIQTELDARLKSGR